MAPESKLGSLNQFYRPKWVHTQSLVQKYDRGWILEKFEEARPNATFSLWPLISFVESEISWSSRRVRWCWFDDWWRHHQPISVMSCNDNRNFAIYAVQGIRNHARSPMGHLWRNSLHEGFRAWCGLGRNNYFVTWQCSICFSFCYNTKCKRVRSMDLPLAQTTL